MKILFVHEVSWFSKVVYEMHDFPELLSLNGHEVHFLDFEEDQSRAHFKSVTSIESTFFLWNFPQANSFSNSSIRIPSTHKENQARRCSYLFNPNKRLANCNNLQAAEHPNSRPCNRCVAQVERVTI
jgi:hypothetical protein